MKLDDMKKGILTLAAFASVLVLASCGSEETVDEKVAPALEICYYTYDDETSAMTWTAYKTTAKVDVGGTFNEITITGDKSSDDPKKLIESLSFSINTESVETNDEGRNKKIASFFFGKMNEPATITGKVKSLDDNGKATLEVKMNGVSTDVVGEYTLVDGTFDFNATIDVAKWDALKALQSLSEACREKHTGDDGILKTWSEVALTFSTQLASDCN